MATSIRLRLALWYTSLMVVVLAMTLVLSYAFHSISHYENVDRFLASAVIYVLSHARTEAGDPSVDGSVYVPPIDELGSQDIFVRIYNADGRLVASSPDSSHQPEIDPRWLMTMPAAETDDGVLARLVRPLVNLGQPRPPEDGRFLTAVGPEGSRTRLYAIPVKAGDATRGYVEAGESLEWLDQSMARLRWVLVAMSGVGVLCALLGGWAIAGSALRPVSAMASTARAIALSRSFSRRLPDLGRRDELGQLAATFNEMLASLDEAYKAQQRFVADASHELRAPLTAIQGNLELLERAVQMSAEERNETLSYLRKEVRRMSQLVGDLLVLARADAGQGIKPQRVELDRLLMEAFQDARRMAPGRRVSLRELDQVQVYGDPERLKQLLLILIDNALKYTPESGEVRLGLHTEPGSGVITVADTGIGIAPEDLPHIFERFYRADKARSREPGGTGLGLSIAKWIVERHGGHIDVESSVGKGSTFTIRLPLADHRKDSKPVSRLS